VKPDRSLQLKGFDEPVPAWRVVAKGSAESRFEALHGAHVTFEPLICSSQRAGWDWKVSQRAGWGWKVPSILIGRIAAAGRNIG
jgi:hypothetical protein